MMAKRSGTAVLAALLLALLLVAPAEAEQRKDAVRVAVAANFTTTMKELAAAFTARTGMAVVPSFGASGQLVAQIANGAPFDILLAADNEYPTQLVERGLGLDHSRFIYARGRLALWSGTVGYVDAEGRVLENGNFAKIAVANPKIAPYGRATREALQALGLLEQLQPRFVTGENIAQTQQFVASGSVPLGFVALAQVLALPEQRRGSYWVVPAELHQPLDQEAILLKRAERDAAARAFLDFLLFPEAIAIMRRHGYEAPPDPRP